MDGLIGFGHCACPFQGNEWYKVVCFPRFSGIVIVCFCQNGTEYRYVWFWILARDLYMTMCNHPPEFSCYSCCFHLSLTLELFDIIYIISCHSSFSILNVIELDLSWWPTLWTVLIGCQVSVLFMFHVLVGLAGSDLSDVALAAWTWVCYCGYALWTLSRLVLRNVTSSTLSW